VLNMTGKPPARIHWEVTLSRKACVNANQSIRKRIEYIRAVDQEEARQMISANPLLAAFRVSSIREART